MELSSDQQLRKELLKIALTLQGEIEAAIEMAARMEHYVLQGCDGRAVDIAATDVPEGRVKASSNAVACKQGADKLVAHQHEQAVARKRRWSEEDDADLKRLWCSTLSLDEIADRMDRTVPSLYSRARALGFGRRDQSAASNSAERVEPAGIAAEPGQAGRAAAPQQLASDAARSGAIATAAKRKTPSTDKVVGRYRPQAFGGKPRSAQGWRATSRGGGPQLPRMSNPADAAIEVEFGVEPIIQFLRSRDYSVVRVEEGCFRIDGRRVVNADQLREKANQVRESLGLPPFAHEFVGASEQGVNGRS